MRIVVVGGWAPSLINFRGPLLEALVAAGHEVIGMGAEGTPSLVDRLARLGVAFEELPLERAGLDPLADARAVAHLIARFRTLRPDLVFAYTIKPVIYASLAARIARVPRRAALITGLGFAFSQSGTLRQRAITMTARGLYRVALRGVHALLFQNPDDRDELAALGLVPRRTKVTIVRGSGVDLAHYAPSPLPPGPPVFVYVGRILRDKGIREYVAAARAVRRKHPHVRFRMIGWYESNPDSVPRAEFDEWIASGDIEYRSFVDDIRPEIAAAHVLVLPSYREGTPRSVLEAMSMRRAVIVTDVPGCRETIVPGEHGIMVPARDVAPLAAAIERLIANPTEIERFAAAGHTRARELYDARAIARATLAAIGAAP
jgi:glycosyltransferase involved in cell wall biosynthesis